MKNDTGGGADDKAEARAFFEKASDDIRRSNYPLAEFYLQAAVKKDPDNQEYRAKLEEVRKIIGIERKEKPVRKIEALKPGREDYSRSKRMGELLGSLAPEEKGRQMTPSGAEGLWVFGFRVKGLSSRALYAILGVALGLAVVYSFFSFLGRGNPRVEVAELKSVYGIEFQSASIVDREFHGIVSDSWNQMDRAEKEEKVSLLFKTFQEKRRIESLILWDKNYQTVAKASDFGVKIF
jgi:hypothetical protein